MTCCSGGVQLYWYRGAWRARPCPHCDQGARILALWIQDGPWRHLNEQEIAEIMSRPHAPGEGDGAEGGEGWLDSSPSPGAKT